ARDRLHAVGRPRHLCLAGDDDPARQDHGRERTLFGEPAGRTLSQAQDRRRDIGGSRAVTEPSKAPVGELLAQSLLAWGIAGSVERTSDGAFRIHAGAREISVERATGDLPFRWMVAVGGRS